MNRIKVYNNIQEIDISKWNELVRESPTASFFQTEVCYRFYESLSFFKPFVFAVESEKLKGVIQGYIQQERNSIKHFFTRRAIIPGGALLRSDITSEELKALLDECKRQLRKQAIYVELRNFNDYSIWKSSFEKNGFNYIPHLNFHVDTTTEEVMLSNLGKSRKRDIRTSFRDGASVIDTPTLQDVMTFYSILRTLYKTKVKTPLFPFEFFEKLFTLKLGIYQLVQYDGKVIGGTLSVGLEGKAVYEWFACGEDGVYSNIYPSTVATYAGMKYAATHGYPLFDMMGAGKPDEAYGVRAFKEKFGGVLVEHGRFLIITKPILYQIGKLGVKIMKR